MKLNENDRWDNLPFKFKPGRIVGLLAIIAIIIGLLSGITVVDSTERAVVFNRASGNLSILDPGFHYVMPFVSSVATYDAREVTYTESAIGISLDLQETTTEVTVRYAPDASQIQTIHQTLGSSYQQKIVVPAVQSCVKNSVSHYNVEQLTGNIRTLVNNDIERCIEADLKQGYLIKTKVSVTDFDFSQQFNHAIEAKAIAQQAAQEERNRLEQVKYKANQTIVQAEAQAKAITLLAEANNANSENGSSYLFLEWLKVWDGKLPTVMSNDNSSLLITPPSN